MKAFTKAYKLAAKQLAHEMSQKLRENAAQDGWHPEVASGLTVKYGDEGFDIQNNLEHNTVVFDLEYGTQNKQGTATLHRFQNQTKEPLDRFAKLYKAALSKELKKK